MQNLCYVALDYEAELGKDTEASYEVAAAGWFTLARERFQTGEILFQPRIAGMYVHVPFDFDLFLSLYYLYFSDYFVFNKILTDFWIQACNGFASGSGTLH